MSKQTFSWVSADPFVNISAYLCVLIFGMGSIIVPSYLLSCVFGTMAWACFYHVLRSLIESQFPKTSELVDPIYPSWSIAAAYVSLFHQFAAIFSFGIYFLATHTFDSAWWTGSIGEHWFLHKVEQHLFFCTMGYELKDFMRSPFPEVGLIVHHFFTVLGCLLCLFTPGGMGLVCANCVSIQLGSGFSNAYVMKPTAYTFWVFVVTMTVVNSIAIWLFVEYVHLHLPVAWPIGYGITGCAVVFLRQANVVLECIKHFKPKIDPELPSESAPLVSSDSAPVGE